MLWIQGDRGVLQLEADPQGFKALFVGQAREHVMVAGHWRQVMGGSQSSTTHRSEPPVACAHPSASTLGRERGRDKPGSVSDQ